MGGHLEDHFPVGTCQVLCWEGPQIEVRTLEISGPWRGLPRPQWRRGVPISPGLSWAWPGRNGRDGPRNADVVACHKSSGEKKGGTCGQQGCCSGTRCDSDFVLGNLSRAFSSCLATQRLALGLVRSVQSTSLARCPRFGAGVKASKWTSARWRPRRAPDLEMRSGRVGGREALAESCGCDMRVAGASGASGLGGLVQDDSHAGVLVALCELLVFSPEKLGTAFRGMAKCAGLNMGGRF